MAKNVTKISYNGQKINIAEPFDFYEFANTSGQNATFNDEGRYNRIVYGTGSYINMPNCTIVQAGAFSGLGNVKGVDLINCTNIEDYGFYSTGMSQLNIPNCQTIGNYAFTSTKLIDLSVPNCTFVGSSAFENARSLTKAYLPNCRVLGSNAFRDCRSLTEINIDKCVELGGYVLAGCYSLYSINLPGLSILNTSSPFLSCYNLKDVSMPNVSRISGNQFSNCSSLEKLTFPFVNYTSGQVAYYCSNLKEIEFSNDFLSLGWGVCVSCSRLSKVILRSPFVATLTSSSIFGSTPITNSTYLGYYGSIYVPNRLVSLYQSATNWVNFSERITSIDNLPTN